MRVEEIYCLVGLSHSIGKLILLIYKPIHHSVAALVKVVGYSITKWSERKMASTKLYSGREEYLSSQTYLLGSEQGKFWN